MRLVFKASSANVKALQYSNFVEVEVELDGPPESEFKRSLEKAYGGRREMGTELGMVDVDAGDADSLIAAINDSKNVDLDDVLASAGIERVREVFTDDELLNNIGRAECKEHFNIVEKGSDSEMLDDIGIHACIDHFGKKDLMDEIGKDFAVKHFEIKETDNG